MRPRNPNFFTLSEDEQQEVIRLANCIMRDPYDTFFTTMLSERGEEAALHECINIATNMYLRGKFHEEFGPREIY